MRFLGESKKDVLENYRGRVSVGFCGTSRIMQKDSLTERRRKIGVGTLRRILAGFPEKKSLKRFFSKILG